jgi:hypothetical protein
MVSPKGTILCDLIPAFNSSVSAGCEIDRAMLLPMILLGYFSYTAERLEVHNEDGQGFSDATMPSSFPSKSELLTFRTKCKRDVMLDWHLRFQENASQPCLKLFSRIL